MNRSANAKQTEVTPVNAIELLQGQHREVEKLFAQIEKTGDRAVKARKKLFGELKRNLDAHAYVEEHVLYPEGKKVDKDLTLEAYEEHDVLKDLLAKISRTAADHETFMAKVTVLKEVVEHHVKEEEKEFFPKLRKQLGNERLVELGTRMSVEFERQLHAKARQPRAKKGQLRRVK